MCLSREEKTGETGRSKELERETLSLKGLEVRYCLLLHDGVTVSVS